MTNQPSDSSAHNHPLTETDLTNNSSVISDAVNSGSANAHPTQSQGTNSPAQGANPANSDNMTADLMAQPQPPAQDTGQTSGAMPDLHTSPPTEPLPLTSSTGTGFNTPDAGTGVTDNSASADKGASNTGSSGGTGQTEGGNATSPGAGNIDRDALAGQNKGAGSQANVEAVSSTGPV